MGVTLDFCARQPAPTIRRKHAVLYVFSRTFTCYLINHRQFFSHTPKMRRF
jgi:hypothetical protein